MTKIRSLFIFFSLLLLIVCVKLFFIQILGKDASAENNYLKTQQLIPKRGSIFDRAGNPLAINQPTYLLYLQPQNIQDKDKTIEAIDSVLHMGTATLEGKIDMSKVWVSIQSGLSGEQKKQLEQLHLKGYGFENENKRFYPESSLSAHLLGFVGKKSNGGDIGYFGLEGYYGRDLAGTPGIIKTERDLFGNPIFIGIQDKVNGEDGRDLISTIDENVQRIAKIHLKEGMEKYQAKEGCVTVANPQTMEILAMTCLPDYDPTQYYSYDDALFVNPVISSAYEPGSVFKPLIMAAALNERVLKPSDTYDENGPIKVGEYQINTWDKTYEGTITMTRALEKSSNVTMVYVGQKLGDKKLLEYIKKYGFGKTTGIDLQGEGFANLKPDSGWYPIDYATATFGQGIAVTQIQLLRAFSAIINGGKLMRPMMVSSIKSDTGVENKIQPHVDSTIIDERSSMLIRQMLEDTVINGEIKYPLPQGYHVGGKTGTAQIPIAGHYDASKTIASFVGFTPVNKPKLIILVSLKEPAASIWGSETAEPIFFSVIKDLFVYYNIAPENN